MTVFGLLLSTLLVHAPISWQQLTFLPIYEVPKPVSFNKNLQKGKQTKAYELSWSSTKVRLCKQFVTLLHLHYLRSNGSKYRLVIEARKQIDEKSNKESYAEVFCEHTVVQKQSRIRPKRVLIVVFNQCSSFQLQYH